MNMPYAVLILLMFSCAAKAANQTLFNSLESLQVDDSVTPCEDFYQYINGKWIEQAEIPATRSTLGGLDSMLIVNDERISALLDELLADGPHKQGSDQQIIADMYTSLLDTEQRNENGLGALIQDLEELNKISTKEEYMKYVFSNSRFQGPISWDANPNCLDPSTIILHITPSSTQQSFFTGDDEYSKKVRDARKEMMQKISDALGAGWNISALYELEEAMNAVSPVPSSLTVENICTFLPLDDLIKMAPDMFIKDAVDVLGVTDLETKPIQVMFQDYYPAINEIFNRTDLNTWKMYSAFNYAKTVADSLTTDFEDILGDFKSIVTGAEQAPLKERASDLLSNWEPFGHLYADKYFSKSSKKKVESMIQDVMFVLRGRLVDNPWMTTATKAAALKKLDAMSINVGYPSKWNNFTGLQITPDNVYANMKAEYDFWHSKKLTSLYKPSDRGYWQSMTPASVNAFYDPKTNSINFPAAILAPPMFSPNNSDAVNYGSIGFVIGHEIIHGFDTNGAQYGPAGSVESWWQPEDYERFQSLAKRLEEQYDQYEALPGLFVDGKLTVGENIADLGGLILAYQAFKSFGRRNTQSSSDKWTADEEFFLAAATTWGIKYRPEYLKSIVNGDPHSPTQFRVNGPLSNMEEFDAVFQCNGSGLLNPPDKQIVIY
jgi:putative endopeptidase